MNNIIGQQVQVKSNRMLKGKPLIMTGICYGRVKAEGGMKYLVKELKVVEPKIMGFRKVKKI